MKVDRTRFLLLTGALSAAVVGAAGSACTIKDQRSGDPTPTPGDVDSGGSGSDGDSGSNGSSTDASDAAACLGDDGVAPTCEGGDAAVDCATLCATNQARFKKGFSREVASCLLSLPTCEGNPAVADCFQSAATKLCDDPTVVAYCAPLICDEAGVGVQKSTCELSAKALGATGRTELADCIDGAGGPCSEGATFCFESLL